MIAPPRPPRTLPGPRGTCERCGGGLVWAKTVASPNGPGGKAMPLDPVEHPDGNVAVRPGHAGRIYAQVMAADEQPDVPVEYRAMPHFATCPAGRR